MNLMFSKRKLGTTFSRMRDKLGTAGLLVAIVALVAALGGTALAAKGALTGKQKKEVSKIAKKEAKKFAKSGPQGPAGPTGPTGTAGVGTTGPTGADGKSVAIVGEGPELCEKSPTVTVPGVTYQIEGSSVEKTICDGAPGEDGSPWTAGGTLPPGATEAGTWAVQGEGEEVYTALPFSIPLSAPIASSHIHISGEAGFGTVCTGGIDSASAKPGELCVYISTQEGATSPSVWQASNNSEGTSRSGALLVFNMSSGGVAVGSYAVTGCGTGSPCP